MLRESEGREEPSSLMRASWFWLTYVLLCCSDGLPVALMTGLGMLDTPYPPHRSAKCIISLTSNMEILLTSNQLMRVDPSALMPRLLVELSSRNKAEELRTSCVRFLRNDLILLYINWNCRMY